jgi:hypothetical protein
MLMKLTTEETMESDIGSILTFRRLINLIDEIANVMKSAFGVNGKAVLISQKSPRTICVTKVGFYRVYKLE